MKKLIISLLVIITLTGCITTKELEQAKAITRQEVLTDVLEGIKEISFQTGGNHYMGVYATVLVVEDLYIEYKENDAKFFN